MSEQTKFGEMLRLWRTVNRRTFRDLANETGISAATLLRLEQGKPCDVPTAIRLMQWIFMPESKR